MSILCLVPMRANSSRLPYKHFCEIGDNRVLDLIHMQLEDVFGGSNVVYCLPSNEGGNLLEDYLTSKGRNTYRGDEENVLARLQGACRNSDHEWVARVNGDNVIILKDLLRNAIQLAESSNDVDLVTNVQPRHFPKGCSVELIKRDIFLDVDSHSLSAHDVEHVFPYFYRAVSTERIKNIEFDSNFSNLDFSLDDFRQLDLLRFVSHQRSQAWNWGADDLSELSSLFDRFKEEFPFSGRSGVYTIAEVGGNHEGNFEYAKKLVQAACDTQVDSVKLQVYSPDLLVNKIVDEDRHSHFGKFALTKEQYRDLFKMIRDSGKDVSASVWSIKELDYFIDDLDFIKIGSGDLTDSLMLDHVRELGKPVILSTGLSQMEEIDWAVGKLEGRKRPFKCGVLQCSSMYPIPDMDSNLRVIDTLAKKFGVIVGYSDHTIGKKALELSVAAGAKIQEFHFTDSRENKSFRDHFVSLTPKETDELIEENIQTITLLGDHNKHVTLSEEMAGHVQSFRKGAYLCRNMNKGDSVTAADLITLRPCSGISAKDATKLVGRTLSVDVEALAPLDFSQLD